MKKQTEKEFREEQFNKKIEQAKTIAKEDYNDYMDFVECRNPNYKRKWVEHKVKNNGVVYSLYGTPDKAFVVVDMKTKHIKAVRQDKSVIAEFY